MPLAVNDIVQVTVFGQKDGNTILNVFHYQCTTAPSTGTPAENIGSLLNFLWEVDNGMLQPAWMAVHAEDYLLRAVRGQRVNPSRTAYVEQLLVDTGDIQVNTLNTSNLSWVIVKQSDTPGRRGKGTLHMVVPSTDWIIDGQLDQAGAADRTTLANLLDDQVTVPAGGVFVPVIYHPNFSPNFSRITHATIMQTIRTMSRRTVGRGI